MKSIISIIVILILIMGAVETCSAQTVYVPEYEAKIPPGYGLGFFVTQGQFPFGYQGVHFDSYSNQIVDTTFGAKQAITMVSLQADIVPRVQEPVATGIDYLQRFYGELSFGWGDSVKVISSFGFGGKFGYGWNLGENFSINLLNQMNIGVAFFTVPNQTFRDTFPGSSAIPDPNFDGLTMSIGSSNIVMFEFSKVFDVDVSFDQQQLMPSGSINWGTLGSGIIWAGTAPLCDYLSNVICKNTPVMLPIADFVLNGALQQGAYRLRLSNANYPFASPPALGMSSFKIGFSFKWSWGWIG